MANPANITRRAAIVGALAAPAAAIPVAAAEPVTTLEDLVIEFKERAIALDPTITGVWVGTDELLVPRRPIMSVFFERDRKPFVQPAAKRA